MTAKRTPASRPSPTYGRYESHAGSSPKPSGGPTEIVAPRLEHIPGRPALAPEILTGTTKVPVSGIAGAGLIHLPATADCPSIGKIAYRIEESWPLRKGLIGA